jgi:drug/metabolite transporter (DMT)-like permease
VQNDSVRDVLNKSVESKKDIPKKYWVEPYWVVTIALVCSILWGSAFPVLKLSYSEMHIASNDVSAIIILAGMRFFLAALMLFILARFGLREALRLPKAEVGAIVFLGILQISLQYFFFYNGLAHTSGMKGAILQSFGTFVTVLLAHFFYKNDRLNWQKGLGLITGFAGIVFANLGKSLSSSFSWQGEGLLMLSGLSTAFSMIIAKQLSQKVHPVVMTAWQMFLGSLLLVVTGLPGLQSQNMIFTPKAWFYLGYSAFLSAAAFSLWYSLLKYNKAGEISIYRFMVPVSGAILSAVLIPGEQFTLPMLGALLFVTLGIIAVNYSEGT